MHALGQVIQHIFLVIVGVFHVFIEVIHVVCPDTQYRQFALGRKIGYRLELQVVVHRKKRQSDHIEQKLEITPSGGHDKRRFRGKRTVQREPEIGSPESSPYFYFVRVSRYLPEVEQGTHQVAPVRGKGSGIKVYFFHEIDIHDAHHASRRPLRGKMIEIRQFHVV